MDSGFNHSSFPTCALRSGRLATACYLLARTRFKFAFLVLLHDLMDLALTLGAAPRP
jgi:hypothetical protein